MHFLSVVLIFISTIRSQQLSSTFTLTHQGSAFQPPNSVELLLTSNVPKLVSCSMACFAHFYCRVFDYDTTSKRCRLFESMLSTGTMISSSSVVGEMHLTPENYFFFNHTGDHCQNSRYLMVNASSNRCVCPKHTFWNASLCLNQVYEGSACVADEWCRADFDLMCRQTMPRICISRNSTTVIDLTSVVPTATSSAIPLTINFNQTYPAPVNSSNAAAGLYGVNLLANGDAETGPCVADRSVLPPTLWSPVGTITQIAYNNTGFVGSTLNTPGPSNRGLCYFVGMFSVTTTMSQTIDLVVYRSAIDSGNVSLNLSAWLGGYNDQDDSATVSVDLFNRFFQPIGNRSSIGPVYASDRQNVTSMVFRQYSSMIPVSTRYLTTIVKLVRFATADNDGNADNIAVVFNLS